MRAQAKPLRPFAAYSLLNPMKDRYSESIMSADHLHSSAKLWRGVLWASASALGASAFMIPWKIATDHGEARHAVVFLLAVAALLNSVVRGLVLGILTLAGNAASAAAIDRISAPLLAALLRSEVVVVAVVAWLALREKVELSFWLGALVAGCGIFLLYGQASSQAQTTGMLYGFVAATSFAVMVVVTRRWIAAVDAVLVNGLRLWFSVGLWGLFYLEWPSSNELSLEFMGLVALAAFFGPFLGRLCMMWSLLYVEARVSALCVLSSPVMTLALSWLLLGEVPHRAEVLGSIVLLVGVALPLVAQARRP